MALDFKEIRKTIIDAVKASIGDDLSQTTNPVTQETYGMVFNARPNPELPVPEYSYAVLDITGVDDTDWYLTNLNYNESSGSYCYETSKTLNVQISIFGSDALLLSEKLKTSFRRQSILDIISEGGLGIGDIQNVQILPELLQTDWLESAFLQMTIRANDVYEDTDLSAIQAVVVHGELECSLSSDPMDIDIFVDTRNDQLESFIFTVQTDQTTYTPYTATNQFALPLSSSYYYDMVIDWGDGNVEEFVGQGEEYIHTYAQAGSYTIKLTGTYPSVIFNVTSSGSPTSDGCKIFTVEQWGNNAWHNVELMFNACRNITGINATDAPNLFNVRSCFRMFRGTTALVDFPSISSWSFAPYTSLKGFFSYNFILNEPEIANLDTHNVNNTSYMFLSCYQFDQPLNWDTSNVKEFQYMFSNAYAFSQDLSGLDFSSISTSDVEIGTIYALDWFLSDTLSDYPLPNVPWETLEAAKYVLSQYNTNYTQDISTWGLGQKDNQDLTGFFDQTTWSTEKYDSALEQWAGNSQTARNVIFDAGSTQYSLSQQSNRDYLTDILGWEITDAGST